VSPLPLPLLLSATAARADLKRYYSDPKDREHATQPVHQPAKQSLADALERSVGQNVPRPLAHCSARGGCDCDCSWANPNTCAADDKTCCHACCCGGHAPAVEQALAPVVKQPSAEREFFRSFERGIADKDAPQVHCPPLLSSPLQCEPKAIRLRTALTQCTHSQHLGIGPNSA
jgi:hypothetical protein